MKTKRVLVGLFDDDHVFLKAIKTLRAKDVKINDAFMPFPVHGFEDALGMKESKLHVGGFWVGFTGLALAILFIFWANHVSWPINWGGKPTTGMLAWVPILFEVTVLTSAIAMFLAFIIRNTLYPGKKPVVFDKRLTDDKFALTFSVDALSDNEVAAIKDLLQNSGAIEIKVAETEDSRLLNI